VLEQACRRAGGLADCAAERLCVQCVLRGPQKDAFLHSGLAAGGAGYDTEQATLTASFKCRERLQYST
jgi:hypothetical protein